MKRIIILAVVLGVAISAFAIEIDPLATFYFWYWYNISDYPDWYGTSNKTPYPFATTDADTNGFEVERVYLGLNFKTDWKLSGQFLLDVGRDPDKDYTISTTTDEDENVKGVTLTSSVNKAPYHAYLKHAYLQYPIFNEYVNFRLGVIPTTFPNEVTKAWGYRFVAAGPIDGFAKWESSADLGVVMFGGYKKWILYNLTLTNGEGYTQAEKNSGKALSLMLQTYPLNMVKVMENLNLALYGRANSIDPNSADNTVFLGALLGWKNEFDFGLGVNLGFVGGLQRHEKKRGYDPDYAELGRYIKETYDTSYNFDDPTDGVLLSGFGEISYSLKGVSVDYGKVALFGRYDIFDPNGRNDIETYDEYVREFKNDPAFDPVSGREITGVYDAKAFAVFGVSYSYKKFRVALDYQTTLYEEHIDSDDADADFDYQKPADSFIFLNAEFSF